MPNKTKSKARLGDLRHVQRVPGSDDDYRRAAKAEASLIPRSELELHQLRDESSERMQRIQPTNTIIVRKPHLEALLGSAMSIVASELEHLKTRSHGGKLSSTDAGLLHKLVEDVTKLTREQRAIDKEALDELAGKDMDELEAILGLKGAT